MLWAKQSATAGLGGLMPREAARGAFQLDCFQYMDDLLADPDSSLGSIIDDVSFDLISFEFLLHLCRTCRTKYIILYVNIIV